MILRPKFALTGPTSFDMCNRFELNIFFINHSKEVCEHFIYFVDVALCKLKDSIEINSYNLANYNMHVLNTEE